jgi:hypothetical protein
MSGGLKIRVTALGTLVAVSVGLATGIAAAQAPSPNTSIKIEGTRGATVQNLKVFGTVSSPSRECVAGRKVKILSLGPNGRKLVDTDRTSHGGSFRGGGDFGREVDGVRVKVTRTVVSRNGHERVCEADAQTKAIL